MLAAAWIDFLFWGQTNKLGHPKWFYPQRGSHHKKCGSVLLKRPQWCANQNHSH
jgi:hypothetical protein